MVAPSSFRGWIFRAVALPPLLLGLLATFVYWQRDRLLAAGGQVDSSATIMNLNFGLALGLSLSLSLIAAFMTWCQLRKLSLAYDTALENLQAQTERRERDQLGQIAEAMQYYAIVLLDAQGLVASWDHDAERILGYRPDDVLARSLALFYEEEDVKQGKPQHDLKEAATEGRSDDERWMVRKDGYRFKASVAIIAIRDPEGGLCGFTEVIREVAGPGFDGAGSRFSVPKVSHSTRALRRRA